MRRFMPFVVLLCLGSTPALAQVIRNGNEVSLSGNFGQFSSADPNLEIVVQANGNVTAAGILAGIVQTTGSNPIISVLPGAQLTELLLGSAIQVLQPGGSQAVIVNGGSLSGGFAAIRYTGSAFIANAGTLNGTGFLPNFSDGIFGGSGTVSNFGSITGDRMGISIESGTVVNSGLIQGRTQHGIDLSAGGGFIQNIGNIIGAVDGIQTDGRTVVQHYAGTIQGGTNGINVVTGGGEVINAATIVGGTTSGINLNGGPGRVLNTGLIQGTGGGANGVQLDSGFVSNLGTIRGGLVGILADSGSLAVINSGTVTGTVGVLAIGALSLINSGTIEGTAGDGAFGNGTSDVLNFGRILATVDAVDLDSGVVVNAGLIQGGATGVEFDAAGTGIVFNHGTINGGNQGVEGESVAAVVQVVNFGSGRIHGGTVGVQINGSGSVDNFGRISGTTGITGQNLTIRNFGQIVASGANAISLTAGTNLVELHASSTTVGNIVGGPGTDTLRLLGAGDYSGTVTLFESLQVGGFWNLGGAITATRTFVNAGQLNINSTLVAPGGVQVFRGAILGGRGAITGGVTIFPGGGMNPGASVGTLSINGPVSFGQGSTLVIEMAGRPTPGADLLNHTDGGSAITVNSGAVLAPKVFSGHLRAGDRFRVIQSANANGLVGNFVIKRPSAAIGVIATQTASTLDLTITRTPYANLGRTPNQRAIGLALDSVMESATGDMRTVLDDFDKLDFAPLDEALSLTDPEFYDVYRETGMLNYRSVAEMVDRHLGVRRSGRPGTDLASGQLSWDTLLADGGGVPLEEQEWRADGFSIWGGAYASRTERDEETDVSELDIESVGPRVGWDYRITKNIGIGGFFGASLTEIDFPERIGSDEAEHDAYTFGVHGSYDHPIGLHVHGMLYGGVDFYETERTTAFARQARSDHDGYHIAGRIGAHYIWQTGPWGLGPIAHADYLHQGQDSFTETGAGALDLRIKERDVDSFETGLGVVVRYHDQTEGEDFVWIPEFRAKWVREWNDGDRTIDARFRGGPSFSVTSVDPERDSALIGLGFRVHDSGWFSFGVDYDALINDDIESHSVRGAFEIRF